MDFLQRLYLLRPEIFLYVHIYSLKSCLILFVSRHWLESFSVLSSAFFRPCRLFIFALACSTYSVLNKVFWKACVRLKNVLVGPPPQFLSQMGYHRVLWSKYSSTKHMFIFFLSGHILCQCLEILLQISKFHKCISCWQCYSCEDTVDGCEKCHRHPLS